MGSEEKELLTDEMGLNCCKNPQTMVNSTSLKKKKIASH